MEKIQIKIISTEYSRNTEKETNAFLDTIKKENLISITPISTTSLLIQYIKES